ncbi:helix-turn-helix transcriptional regulator [Paenibacillus sp. WLX1005]|uniref:helix-turn-helix transcriptional regulator n=1 Tax=Paenibacillus sp. WLX1005 TaxID=3243766 RepID=UPI00398454B8
MMDEQMRRRALAHFVRSRREKLVPTEYGIVPSPRRRAIGLKREEIAEFAGISATWYTWLEQARDIRLSETALNQLSAAFKLDDNEKEHLFMLSGEFRNTLSAPSTKKQTYEGMQIMLRQMNTIGACIIDHRWDIQIWNKAAEIIWGRLEDIPPLQRNILWQIFGNLQRQTNNPDWETHARHILARFRVDHDRNIGDTRHLELVEELKQMSSVFANWWDHHEVQSWHDGPKQIWHPDIGKLAFYFASFEVDDSPGYRMITYTPLTLFDTLGKVDAYLAK